ncbi:MAG: hypothetical protein JW976_01435 [Syntrophaceae bacterium]|nr:hypothetical protein [Syntrophaceae bacterium]
MLLNLSSLERKSLNSVFIEGGNYVKVIFKDDFIVGYQFYFAPGYHKSDFGKTRRNQFRFYGRIKKIR